MSGSALASAPGRIKARNVAYTASQAAAANPADANAGKGLVSAEGGLTGALSRLMVVSEQYPDLKATQNVRELQAQLEGAENRITVERMRFNEAAQAFDTKLQSFPTNIIAGFFGGKFKEKPYFKAQEGAETAPKVKF